MNLLDLYAKITMDTSGYNKGLDEASGKASSFASKLKSGLATAAKVGAAALTAAAAGVAALTKASIDQYAQYEQLVGGVDTLFKTASDKVQQYAANAYKTAGMSANEYMNTVTSFSASLIKSLGGDTEKAAQKADQAITDMADNANKMGTSMEMIQNAYQGFAKQNYTMLDNLKLGYGGTKEEMQRLLKDAEKLSGIKYDISSYADIVDAIHVVQTEMGITGTTAKEAASTISGSLSMAKAAWKNLLTGVGDDTADLGTLIDNLVDSVSTAAGNIVPRIGKILSGMGEVVAQLAPIIAQELPELISTMLPALVSAGAQLLVGLVTGLVTAIPDLVAAAPQIITALVSAISANLPALMAAGQQLLTMLGNGIQSGIPALAEKLPQVIDSFLDFITGKLPSVLKKGVEMLTELANGILSGIPQLLSALPKIIESIVEFITENLPVIVDAGINLLLNLANGIISALPNLVADLPKIITSITTTLNENLPKIIQAGFELLIKLGEGILAAIPDLLASLPQVVSAILDGVGAAISGVYEIGKNIVKGLWEGIKSMFSWIKDKVGGFFDGILGNIKDLLGIHSPSRVFRSIGEYMMKGLEIGLEDSSGKVMETVDDIAKEVKTRLDDFVGDVEHALYIAEKNGAVSAAEMVDSYILMQDKIHEAAKWYRKQGYAETSDEIQELQKLWWGYQDSIVQVQDELAGKLQDAYKNIDEIEAKYQDKLSARAQEIFEAYGLFDDVPERQRVSGQELIDNLSDQVSAIDEFYSSLETLAERGVADALVSDIRKMGPEAIDQLSALLDLSDEKLSEYSALYQEKQALANRLATEELKGLRKETDSLLLENIKAMEGLFANGAPGVATALTDGLISGIKNGASGVISTAANMARAVVDAVKRELGAMDGITRGLDFGAASVDFASSGLGVSSAGIINSMAAGSDAGFADGLTVNLTLPDGTKFATWQLPYLIKAGSAAGTPIADPQLA